MGAACRQTLGRRTDSGRVYGRVRGRSGEMTSGGRRDGPALKKQIYMDVGWAEEHRTGGHYLTYVGGLSMCNEFYFYNEVPMYSMVFDSCR